MRCRDLMLTVSTVCVLACAPCRADEPQRVSLWLGYSFGLTQFDAVPAQGVSLLNETTGNEPLVALIGEVGGKSATSAEVILALANFGQLITATGPAGSTADSATAADVRRSLLLDFSLRRKLFPNRAPNVQLTLNTGFVLDAQSDEEGENVADASSYFFIGPMGRFVAGKDSSFAEVEAELLVGQSEVMTRVEPFSRPWSDNRTLRVRPKATFTLLGKKKGQARSLVLPVSFGLWCDLGFDSRTGDTYALFVSRPIWSTD